MSRHVVASRPIIVLGAERSGTSLVASMIDRWGAYVGEPGELSEGDERNPRGYWEYRPLWNLAEKVGDLPSGTSWWEESFVERVAGKLADADLVHEAQHLIARMESQDRPWMWKDPALCHFLHFWTPLWTDPIYVLTVRDPIDVARSWQAFGASFGRIPTSMTCNLLRWQHMSKTVIAATGDVDENRIFVQYERVLREPGDEAARLAAFLDARVATVTTGETIAGMAAQCDSTLHHHGRGGEAGVARLSDSQQELYDGQRRRAADLEASFDSLHQPMLAGWRELVLDEERRAESSQRLSSDG